MSNETQATKRERIESFLRWFNSFGIVIIGLGLYVFDAKVDTRIDAKLKERAYLEISRYEREQKTQDDLTKARAETLAAKFATIEKSIDAATSSTQSTEAKVISIDNKLGVVIERLDSLRVTVDKQNERISLPRQP